VDYDFQQVLNFGYAVSHCPQFSITHAGSTREPWLMQLFRFTRLMCLFNQPYIGSYMYDMKPLRVLRLYQRGFNAHGYRQLGMPHRWK